MYKRTVNLIPPHKIPSKEFAAIVSVLLIEGGRWRGAARRGPQRGPNGDRSPAADVVPVILRKLCIC